MGQGGAVTVNGAVYAERFNEKSAFAPSARVATPEKAGIRM